MWTDAILLICPTGGVPLAATSAPGTIIATFEFKENASGMTWQRWNMAATDAVGIKNARTAIIRGRDLENSIAAMAMVDWLLPERQVPEKFQRELTL